jgi:hypothetical protein
MQLMNGQVHAIIQGGLCFLSSKGPADHWPCLESSDICQEKCLGEKRISHSPCLMEFQDCWARWSKWATRRELLFSILNSCAILHQSQLMLSFESQHRFKDWILKFMLSKLDYVRDLFWNAASQIGEPAGPPRLSFLCVPSPLHSLSFMAHIYNSFFFPIT